VKKVALFVVPAVLCFVVALVYQLRVFNTRIVLIFDSAHYLLTASQIAAIFRAFLAGHSKEALVLAHSPDFISNVMIDGPVLPAFGALTFLLTGQPAAATSWPVVVGALALLAAITAGCVGLVTRTLTKSYAFAYGAAILYALYPSTIVSAGRFLTEPLATLNLILLAMASAQLLISKKRTTLVLSGVAIGVLVALGFLTKTALLPAWFFLPVTAIIMRYRHSLSRDASSLLRPALAIATGAAIVLGVWLSFTKFATGNFELMPQRMPAFNLATGNNPETDGRATMPAHPLTLHYGDMGKSTQIIGSAWADHGGELANLYMRKIPRVMGFVWNDFKQVVLGINVDVQNGLHGVVLALSLIGLFWFLIALSGTVNLEEGGGSNLAEFSCERRYWMLAIGGLIVIHTLLYLPFESIVRYGAPVAPFVIIAAAAGSCWIYSQKGMHKAVAIALILLCVAAVKVSPSSGFLLQLPFSAALGLLAGVRAALLLSLLLFVLYLGSKDLLLSKSTVARKRLVAALAAAMFSCFVLAPVVVTTLHADSQREYAVNLAPGTALTRSIDLPAASAPDGASEFLAYIDCDTRFEDAIVRVNGMPVQGRLTAANKLDSQLYFLFTIMRMYASIFDMPTDYLRQWRVVPVPSHLIKPGQSNTLEIVAGLRGLTVFGDRFNDGEKTIRLLDRKFYSANRFCNDGTEFETRVLDRQPVTIGTDVQALKTGRQPRLYMLEARPVQATANKIGDGAILFDADLPLKSFDPVLSLAEAGKALKIDRYTLQLARSTSMGTALPQSLSNEEQVEISLRGKITSRGRADKAGVFATLHGSKASTPFMILSASPPFVKAGPEWRDFSIDDRIFLRDFTAGQDRLMLSVGLFPGRWEQFSQYGIDHNVGSFLVKDLHLTVRRLPLNLDLAGCKLRLY
jgi:hypothetical protein